MSDELLDALSRTYSKIRGEHTPEEIIERIWEHYGFSRAFQLSAVEAVQCQHYFLISLQRRKSLRRIELKKRANKRKRRQHRAAFRRRKRGLA